MDNFYYVTDEEIAAFLRDVVADDDLRRAMSMFLGVSPAPIESARVRGLRAMANQDASPNERDIARQKLRDMGLQP